MRTRWLFLRWLALLILVGFGIRYIWQYPATQQSRQYEKVVLLQSSSSFGLPLAGISIDPARREVYGLLGRAGKEVPPNFFILWKGQHGESYGATFSRDGTDLTGLCEILPHGETRTIQDFRTAKLDRSIAAAREPSETMRLIINALPRDSTLPGK